MERVPKRLCLVGCCKQKLSQAAPAQDLYRSPLFRLSRKWAEQHADAWGVMSAHYGVVRPEQVIEPYDTTIRQRQPFGLARFRTRDFADWLFHSVQHWRWRSADRSQDATLVILAGRDYWRWLDGRMAFEVPLDSLGIGERLHWLKEHTS